MKKIFVLIIFIIGIAACENQPWSFPDYDKQTVYFPIQLPIRTLSLGEDRIDNSLDKEFQFDIAVSIGGLFENKKDWTVDYKVEDTLTNNVFIYDSKQDYTPDEKILNLPKSYYTLNPLNTVIIPSGSFNGRIRVQLTSAFFDDTIATTGRYVIPLRITGTSADSILTGKVSSGSAGDPRVTGDWESNASPKDWVMYGIKFVNAYHGTYLHRGRDLTTTTATGLPYDTVIFRAKYVEKDVLIKMTTVGRKKVISNGAGNKINPNRAMLLSFENDLGTPGNITITSAPTANVVITGTGHYQDIATSVEKWTGLTWQSMYLSYSYDDGTYTHQINDTLVFRDRGIKFQSNTIVVQPK